MIVDDKIDNFIYASQAHEILDFMKELGIGHLDEIFICLLRFKTRFV